MKQAQTSRHVRKTIAIVILCFIVGLIATGLIASITTNVTRSTFSRDFLSTWVKAPLLLRYLLTCLVIFKLISLPINLIALNRSANHYSNRERSFQFWTLAFLRGAETLGLLLLWVMLLEKWDAPNRDLTWQEVLSYLFSQVLETFGFISFWVLLLLYSPQFLPLLLLLWGLGIVMFVLPALWVIVPTVGFWWADLQRSQPDAASGASTHQRISSNEGQPPPIGCIYPVEVDSESHLHLYLELNFYQAILGCQKTVRFNRLEASPNYHLTEVTRSLNLTIPAGIPSGTLLRVSQEGNAKEDGGRPGDLYIHLSAKSEADGLKRDGINILSEVRVSEEQAKTGGKATVYTLSRQTSTFIEQTEIDIPPETKNGDLFVLKGYGVPNLGNPSERGDHIIRITVSK